MQFSVDQSLVILVSIVRPVVLPVSLLKPKVVPYLPFPHLLFSVLLLLSVALQRLCVCICLGAYYERGDQKGTVLQPLNAL
jgi:hypothetical protein